MYNDSNDQGSRVTGECAVLCAVMWFQWRKIRLLLENSGFSRCLFFILIFFFVKKSINKRWCVCMRLQTLTQKESTWVLVASRSVQRFDNHLHLFWFGKMCRIPETKFLMSGQNGNGLWWWLYNYSLSYHAVGIQWSSETLAATWLKEIFSHDEPHCCSIKSRCLIASCSWRKEELPKCWYCVLHVLAYGYGAKMFFFFFF